MPPQRDPLVRRMALRAVRPRHQGRARPADVQARLPAPTRTRRSRSASSRQGFEYQLLRRDPDRRATSSASTGRTRARRSSCSAPTCRAAISGRGLMYGTRISLTIGLVGVTLSLVLGVVLGGLSGFYGGVVDTVIQRVDRDPALDPDHSRCGWGSPRRCRATGRSSRSTSRSRSSSRCSAGRSSRASCAGGSSRCARKISSSPRGWSGAASCASIFVHMVPSFMSHIIAATTLAMPAMIISETALSFLGLGLRPPADQLGRAAAAGAERPDGGDHAVADDPGAFP